MKKITSLLITAFGVAMAVASVGCGSKGGASSTMNDTCLVSQTQTQAYTSGNCNYNYGATPGYTSYSNTQYTGFGMTSGTAGRGCSNYQLPVYSESKGVGCVDGTYVTTSGTPAIYVLVGSTFVLGNSAGTYQSTIAGSASVLRACDGNDGCPSSQTCRSATGTVSPTGLGICYF